MEEVSDTEASNSRENDLRELLKGALLKPADEHIWEIDGLLKRSWVEKGVLRSARLLSGNDSVMRSFHNRAKVKVRSKLSEAERIFREALDGQEKSLGPEHPQTIKNVEDLGCTLGAQRKFAEAEKMFRRVLLERGKKLGREHPDTLRTADRLERVLEYQSALSNLESLDEATLQHYHQAMQNPTETATDRFRAALVANNHKEARDDQLRQTLMEPTLDSELASTLPSLTFEHITNSAKMTASTWTSWTGAHEKPIAKAILPLDDLRETRDTLFDDPFDIQSIASADDDIQSSIDSLAFTNIVEAGASAVVKAFSDVTGISDIYDEASTHMQDGVFVSNHRRLLKLFYLEASQAAESATSNVVIRFLRSRRARTRISARIYDKNDHLAESNEEDSRRQVELYLTAKAKKGDISRWANSLTTDVPNDDEDFEEPDYSPEEDTGLQLKDLPLLSEAAEFLVNSAAFNIYRNNIQRFVRGKPLAPTEFRTALLDKCVKEARTLLDNEPEAVTQKKFGFDWIREKLQAGDDLDAVIVEAIARLDCTSDSSQHEPNTTLSSYSEEVIASKTISKETVKESSISAFIRSLPSSSDINPSAAEALISRLQRAKPHTTRVIRHRAISMRSKVQLSLERLLRVSLEWWPLPAPQRHPLAGLASIDWECVSLASSGLNSS